MSLDNDNFSHLYSKWSVFKLEYITTVLIEENKKTHLLAPGFVTGIASQVHKAELVKDCCLKAIPCKRWNKNTSILVSDCFLSFFQTFLSTFSNAVNICHGCHYTFTVVKTSSIMLSFVVTSIKSSHQNVSLCVIFILICQFPGELLLWATQHNYRHPHIS